MVFGRLTFSALHNVSILDIWLFEYMYFFGNIGLNPGFSIHSLLLGSVLRFSEERQEETKRQERLVKGCFYFNQDQ